MAKAGRVAMIPKGDYDSATTYQNLDVVRYENDIYVAKKASTGVLPTNTDYWMLCMENVTQEQYDALVNGTTPVGNALKLNGLTAEEFVVNENLLINADFKNPVNSSGKTSWTANGPIIDGWRKETTNTLVELTENGVKTTKTISDGGGHWLYTQNNFEMNFNEPTTVTISAKVRKSTLGFRVRLSIYGTRTDVNLADTTEWQVVTKTASISSITGISLTSDNSGGTVLNDWVEIEWIKLELGSVATPFIPPNKEVEKLKCGTTVGDSATVNGVTFYKDFTEINNTFNKTTPILDLVTAMTWNSKFSMTVWAGSTDVYPTADGILELDKTDGNYTSARFTSLETGKIYTGACYPPHSRWTGWEGFLSLTGGTVTATHRTPIGINNTVEPVAYIMFSNGETGLGGLGLHGAKCPVYKPPTNEDIYYPLLHTGNSLKVQASNDAPTDTATMWYDTANKTWKRYVDGAWTA